MDTLKNQFARIQEQLNGLTASQKMLTAALAAIMVMTLVWWGKYAGDPEMEALLDQSLSQDDAGRIAQQLRADHIPFKTEGNRILVPAERRLEALGTLGFAKVLPRSTANGFDEMIKQVSPFASPSQTAEVLKRAREQALAEVIRHFPGVSDAFVMVDPAPRRQIGSGASVPSATVNIVTNGTTRSRQLALAAADLVTGANAGLARGNVKVIVDGTPQPVGGTDDEIYVSGQFENRQRIEREYQIKIADLLQNMGPVLIAVNAHVDLSRMTKSTIGFNKDSSLVLPRTESSQNAESSGGGGIAGEPGVAPNVGGSGGVVANGTASVGGGTAGTEASTSESTEQTTNEVYAGRSDTRVEKGPGETTVLSASVRVPRSYFVKVLKGHDAAAKEPDEKKLNEFIQSELASVRAAVRSCTGLKSDDQLSVDAYYDLPLLPLAGAVAPQLASTGALPFGLGAYGKQLALGGLALVSLFLVSMMVRKASPAAPVVAVASLASASPLTPVAAGPALVDSAEPLAGEVSGGDPMMAGMELDEESVRTRQMIDQVSTLVQENPDAAATLVKRWLNRG
jgi:flagellar M-ring protein FliF